MLIILFATTHFPLSVAHTDSRVHTSPTIPIRFLITIVAEMPEYLFSVLGFGTFYTFLLFCHKKYCSFSVVNDNSQQILLGDVALPCLPSVKCSLVYCRLRLHRDSSYISVVALRTVQDFSDLLGPSMMETFEPTVPKI